MRTALKPISFATLVLLLVTAPVFISGTGVTSLPPAAAAVNAAKKKSATKVVSQASILYVSMQLSRFGLSKAAFEYGLKGYQYLLSKRLINKDNVLSICDFSQSSRHKRLFIIDLMQQKLLIYTYVAHGRNSGSEYARSFSNNPDSHKSSLGFYKTESTYYGDHGLALKMEGLEKGFNDRANSRNIVMHGSKYVGADFLKSNRFSGRSYGCPAIPDSQTAKVINTIKNGSCLFIYHPTKKYLAQSKILNG